MELKDFDFVVSCLPSIKEIDGIHLISIYDSRDASFFALGKCEIGRTCLLITDDEKLCSMFSALSEAFYSSYGLKIIVFTQRVEWIQTVFTKYCRVFMSTHLQKINFLRNQTNEIAVILSNSISIREQYYEKIKSNEIANKVSFLFNQISIGCLSFFNGVNFGNKNYVFVCLLSDLIGEHNSELVRYPSTRPILCIKNDDFDYVSFFKTYTKYETCEIKILPSKFEEGLAYILIEE